MVNEIQLKVLESHQDDAYKGIARVDSEVMRSLGVKRGDIIKIKGGRESVAIVDRAYPADVGEGTIRIDGISRKNIKTGIGEIVKISKAEVKEAKKVVIAPTQKNVTVQADPSGLKKGLLGRAIVKGDIVVLGGVQRRRDLLSDDFSELGDLFGDVLGNMGFGQLGGFTQIKFIVVSINPNQPVIVGENTEIILNSKAIEMIEENVPEINYEDIGGLEEEIKKIREIVELPLKKPEIFQQLGIESPKGVLLYGPPGTGKTLLAKAVAGESETNFISISGPEIFSKFQGESEKNIKKIFDEAEKSAPSIIFFDEIDALAPGREDNFRSGESERRVVSQFLTMMDGLKSRGKVIVIGATNRVDSIDPALRRPGRFDREIEINVPNKQGRLSILKIHSRGMPFTKDVKLDEIASLTHGFVGADLESLCKEAAMNVLRKFLPKLNLESEEEIPKEILEKLVINHSDFIDALKFVRPSALREVAVEKSITKWEDVGGIDLVKNNLKEAVEWPLKYPDSFKRMGVRPTKGILLYGPPGTGKTLLARAIANEAEANFIQIDGHELQKEGIVGKETERLRKMFKRARQVSPCIIFFDEIDGFTRKRGGGSVVSDSNESLLNTLITEMDGLEDLNDVLVIGATNRPDMIDNALLRPGRFDRIFLVGAPEEEGRLQILKIHTKNMPLDSDVDLKEVAKKTIGFTGADLESLSREAALIALRESKEADIVSLKHFEEALKKINPSVSKPVLEIYKKIEENLSKPSKVSIPFENSYLG